MGAAGVPIVPGTDGATTIDEARAGRRRDRLPGAAQGGRGRRRQGHAHGRDPDELEAAFAAAAPRRRRRSATPALYVEKAIVPARHVEIQVLGDGHGNVLTLGERDCSIQRRHQKLVEESPSPALDAGAARGRWRRRPSARAAPSATSTPARSSSCSARTARFYFIELNARLQVEHPVTELVTGIDLVREQLRVAAGERLSATGPRGAARPRDRDPHQRRGSGARLPAVAGEDRALPAAARPRRARRHARRGRRRVPPYYDSLLAKVIVWDADRRGDRPRRCARSRSSRSWACRRRGRARATSSAARSSRAGRYSTSFLDEAGRRCPRSPADGGAAGRPAHGPVPALPVGRAGRRSRRSTRARSTRSRASSPRTSPRGRPSSTSGSPRPPRAGRPTGSARSSATSCASAIYELDRGEVPAEVAIDEAVAFAKRYASDEAGRLVNGILGRIEREQAA